MTPLLVAVFDEQDEARRACQALKNMGIADADIHLGQPVEIEHHVRTAAESVAKSHSLTESIGEIFRSLFVAPARARDDTLLYREALKRGCVLLTVRAADPAQGQAIRKLLHDAGAVDLQARQEQWRQRGWLGHHERAPTMADTHAMVRRDNAEPLPGTPASDGRVVAFEPPFHALDSDT